MKRYQFALKLAAILSTSLFLPAILQGVDVNGDGVQDAVEAVYPTYCEIGGGDYEYEVLLYNTDASKRYKIQGSFNQSTWFDETGWVPGNGGMLLCFFIDYWVQYFRCAEEGQIDIDLSNITRIPIYAGPNPIKGGLQIVVDGDPVEPGNTIEVKIFRNSGSSGSSAFLSTGTGTVHITATSQQWVKGIQNSDAKDNIRVQAKLVSTVYDTEDFSVRTWPTNLVLNAAPNWFSVSGQLLYIFGYDSESGNLTHIPSNVEIGSKIVFTGSTPIPPYSTANPNPFESFTLAGSGLFIEFHGIPGGKIPSNGFQLAYSTTIYNGSDTYLVRDPTLGVDSVLLSNLTISRTTREDIGGWFYAIHRPQWPYAPSELQMP